MSLARSVVFTVIGEDRASPAFLRASKSAETAAAGIDRSIAKIRKAGLGMQVVGQKMTKHFTLPLLALGGVSVDQAVKFQKSMTLIQTAGGETAKKAAAISIGIKKVATETGTSLDQLGEGIYTVAKAGAKKWSATGQLQVLKAAAQGAKAENVDLGTSVNALTSVMMSYHLGTKDAVKVENELVRGAGKAKTTMQEYAGSLATVVPIASAAHIKFAQVAGAIATLTQHGTSAQEATQELANTIRNLQAPNNVAVKAMQQLGINVVDVSKNLGKRGLTGTIDLITNAIVKKMGPSGLVAVSAFKKSQSAAADLSIELAHMPKHLADISHQFETGKLGYKQYYLDVKNLGGAAFEMGKGFISTMAQAKGFNDLLKAGNPAAQTFAAYLKKVMGGATGLNTALQLGGGNMKYFKSATKDVSAAAKDAGKNVLGWSKTQDTLAVKADKLKAQLQVLAVNLGTALIPALSKVVGWVQKAVDWFSRLSPGWKKFLGIAALTVAALGPALAIIGRVTKAVALLWKVGAGTVRFIAGMRGAALASESMATRTYSAGAKVRRTFGSIGGGAVTMGQKVRRAAGLAGAALAGIGIGAVVGQMTKDSSTGVKALGVLGSAGAGAAIGFSMGGPWGAALGGLAGGLTNIVTQLHNTGDAAKSEAQMAVAWLKRQKAEANNLLGTLQSVGGAYNDAFRANIADKLSKSGILGVASRAGFNNLPSLINAVVGKGDPGAVIARLQVKLNQAAAAGKITAAEAQRVGVALERMGIQAGGAEHKLELEARASGRSFLTNKQLGTSLGKLRAAFKDTGTSLDVQTGAGQRNREMIRENVQALNQAAASQLKHGKSVQSVAAAYQAQIVSLQANAEKLHLNAADVADLIQKYGHIPRKVATRLLAQGVTTADISAIARKWNLIPRRINTTVTANTEPARREILGLTSTPWHATVTVNTRTGGRAFTSADGGTVPGPRRPYGDKVPAFLAPGEEVITNRHGEADRFRAMRGMGMIPGLADGGTVTQRNGQWYYHGTAYSSRAAAENARRGVLIGNTSTKISAIDVSKFSFSWAKFTKQVKAAGDALSAAIKAGASPRVIRRLRANLEAAEKAGEKQERLLGRSIGKQTGKLGAAIGNLNNPVSRSDMRSQLQSYDATLRQAGVPKSFIKGLDDENKAILNATSARNAAVAGLVKANAKLAAARQKLKQDVASFKSAAVGAFDITTAGRDANGRVTAGSLRAAQGQALTRVREFVSGIKKLAAKKIFPGPYLRSLAGQGPDALPTIKALLSMNPAELKSFAHTQREIANLSGQGAKAVGRRLDQGRVNQAKHEQQVWEKRERRREKHLEKVTNHMVDRIAHELHSLHLVGKLGLTKGELALIVEAGERQNKSRRNKAAAA